MILIVMSIIFYAYGEPKAVFLMLISILVNYLLALSIDRKKDKKYMFLTVFFNVFLLFIFKYLNFFADIISYIFGVDINIKEIPLPIGISFFTFQAMSYVIDVYRGEVKAQKQIHKLVLYIAFFPQLIAGPIVKYHDIEKQLDSRTVNIDKLASGFRLFIFGLSAKLLIANTMGSIADGIFNGDVNQLNPVLSWIGAICYTMQIYFDFSGYSNMAIGLGRMFGFEFLQNFNLPFISKSIQEFWRRWHISLSTWFKEYVYIPLGGNRKGTKRTYINKLFVFTLTGLWHGANITFLVWGLLHGMFIVLEGVFNRLIKRVPGFVMHIYTMFVVIVTFVIFRADNILYALKYLKSMFILPDSVDIGSSIEICNPYNVTIFIFAVLLSLGFHKKLKNCFNKELCSVAGYGLSILLFALCIINISASTYNPFIYFRF